MALELDATAFVATLRAFSRKTYIVQIWVLATIVNRRDEFGRRLNESGQPAVWEAVNPSFTVFNAQREMFSSIWILYIADSYSFRDNAIPLVTERSRATDFFSQGAPPENCFDVSSLP